MTSIVIVDSGPLLAAANAADPAHHTCIAALEDPRFQPVIPALCVAEVAYLLEKRQGPGVEARFLAGLQDFDVRAPAGDDWLRIAELVEEYRNFPLGGTDASVITLAERLETDLILTLDRRHFGAVQARHCQHLRLVPG